MEVITAQSAGFCFGVKRAVDTVYELSGGEKKIYTYGPVIHNAQVIKDLESRGVEIINGLDELALMDHDDSVIVIRSHGVSEAEYERIREAGFEIVDTTCPFVKRIHDAVLHASENGEEILILGSPDHPEVKGIMGWCHGSVQVIDSVERARSYAPITDKPIRLVSQTTFNHKKFEDIVEILRLKEYNVNVMNTICNATLKRQDEAEELASGVDVMIVIGDRHSSNTRKLYDICAASCGHTFFIETLDDLNLDEVPKSVRLVGITAGASTPQNIIEEVQKAWKN